MLQPDDDSIERRRKISLASYHRNKIKDGKSRYQRRVEQGICPKCCEEWAGQTKICPSCCEKQTEANNKYLNLIYQHYGSVCRCCGVTEKAFLTLDHMNNDGAEQRRALTGKNFGSGSNWRFYMVRKAMKTGEWPTDLQILCYNCNSGRARNGGICPHQIQKTSESSSVPANDKE